MHVIVSPKPSPEGLVGAFPATRLGPVVLAENHVLLLDCRIGGRWGIHSLGTASDCTMRDNQQPSKEPARKV